MRKLFLVLLVVVAILFPAAAEPVSADFGVWTSGGPAANITVVAVDPTNDKIIYAGGPGGIWMSSNLGGSWTLQNSTALGHGLTVDPHTPTTLYAIGANPDVILKSTDRGLSWTRIFTGVVAYQFGQIVVDPNRPNAIYTTSGESTAQIVRSLDGGVTWSRILPDGIGMGGIGGSKATGLAMLPGMPDVLYTSIQIYHGGLIMKTANASTVPTPTWTTIASTSQVQSLSSPIDVVAAGNASNRAAYSSWVLMGYGELARNDNDGTPVKLGNALPFRSQNVSSYVSAMAVNPNKADWLYAAIASQPAGQYGVFASANGGQNWTEIGKLNMRVTDLELAVKSHTLFAATSSGVYQMMLKWPVAARFEGYYNRYDGLRTLGGAISAETIVNGYPSQYFEKARIEDHQGESSDPNWRFMYGLLVDELHAARVNLPIGGDVSSLSYADLNVLADPSRRVSFACTGSCPNGVWVQNPSDGTVFIPFTTDLRYAPGHLVLGGFWNYMNRTDLFPGGWLHDVGLPISEPQQVRVTKYLPGGAVQRDIIVQAFQRTILTYDRLNPPEWQIERANVGTDYRIAFTERVGP